MRTSTRFVLVSAVLLLAGAGCFGKDAGLAPLPGCAYTDGRVCRFLVNWKEQEDLSARMILVSQGGQTSVMTMELAGTERSRVTTEVNGRVLTENITVGSMVYTKGPGGWTKYDSGTSTNGARPTKTEALKLDLEGADAVAVTFTPLEEEACGNLRCYKYEVVQTGRSARQYVWFDIDDYKLRKMRLEEAAGTVIADYSYAEVTITPPTQAKDYTPLPEGMTQEEFDALFKKGD